MQLLSGKITSQKNNCVPGPESPFFDRMKRYSAFILFAILCLRCNFSLASEPDSLCFKKKTAVFYSVTGLSYSGSMLYLNSQWYSNYGKSSFHFFNDSREWLQMDKAGHLFTSYYLNRILYDGLIWTGKPAKKSTVLSSGIVMAAMSGIEIFDGYSEKWGASWSDLTANMLGCILFSGQEYLIGRQVCVMKFSFHRTNWAGIRPDALGSTFSQQILKDYNGQTYWFSLGLRSITGFKKIPAWLNISFGYGAEAMLSGNETGSDAAFENYERRYRQVYLSLDCNLSEIKCKNKYIKNIFKAFNCLKLPFPTLVYQKKNIEFIPLYF